jgi:hypothetical protein
MSKKKGSLELSINAIVIIVLAFVLLGLGLGFVRSQFKSMGSTTTQVQEQVKSQILEDLRTGDKKISFPSQRVTIEKGSNLDLAIGVKNTGNSELKFYLDIFTAQDQTNKIKCDEDLTSVSAFEDIPTSLSCDASTTASGTIEDLEFFLDSGPYTLGVADAEVYPISIKASKTSNTYLVKVRVFAEDADGAIEQTPYAEKTFFVQIA